MVGRFQGDFLGSHRFKYEGILLEQLVAQGQLLFSLQHRLGPPVLQALVQQIAAQGFGLLEFQVIIFEFFFRQQGAVKGRVSANGKYKSAWPGFSTR